MNLQYYKANKLVPTILALSLALALPLELCVEPLTEHIPFINSIGTPSIAAVVLFLLGIHNRYLWNKPVGKWLVDVPDISGKYEGHINYEYDNQRDSKKATLYISQTASRINVRCEFSFTDERDECTISESSTCALVEQNGTPRLEFIYRNAGDKVGSHTEMHEGFTSMMYDPEQKKLTGHYFTGRLSKGAIEVVLESK